MKLMPRQTGFSLLEVLITVVIVSLALLGIAGIIANGLKVTHGAYMRSQASWLANDIIDRMRANRARAEIDAYALASCANAPAGGSVAQNDLRDWCAALAAILPSGTGTVDRPLGSNRFTVTVQWDDSRAAGRADTQRFVVETRL